MIEDRKQIAYFRRIAEKQFVVLLNSDYGLDSADIGKFTDAIATIYTYLQYHTFKSVIIYRPLGTELSLESIGGNPTTYLSLENITPLAGDSIVIEVKDNGEVDIAVDYLVDIQALRLNAILYKFERDSQSELIYGKSTSVRLEPIPDADSYFAIQSYKTIELALEDYKTKIARHSDCPFLKNVWFDSNMLFLKAAPEHTLRDSLTDFLKKRLRNAEVRPEQVVDKSHPVDIKVTWSLANRLALIEIKWLGKSLKHRKKQFTKKFYPSRALDGAEQLANYLDANLVMSPTYATKGYLVVFDARRAACNVGTTETVDAVNGLKYLNDEITYSPNYYATRADFAKPYRFFMQPKYT